MRAGTEIDGDAQFNGVNELLPPGVLSPGEVASARNKRFRLGEAEPRLGFFKLPWSNLVTSGASSRPIPYGTYYGSGYFQDGDAVLWLIVAADGKVFKFREGNGSSEVPLPTGVSITSAVNFTQTYNGLVMFRGIGKDTLLMENLDTGFVTATMQANTITGALSANPVSGTYDIPQADRGEWIDARLFVPTETDTEKDLVNISDYLNATLFAGVRDEARINQGSSDRLTRVLKFGKEHAAVCFKTGSIYALYNTTGALSEMSQDEITREFGLLSPRGCINVGKDEADQPDKVWFMGTTGSIYAITPDGGTGLLGVSSVPVSEEIVRTMGRINREVAASTVTFELFDDRLYVAVPLDDGTAYGPELIRSASYDGGGIYEMGLIPGASYEWTKGASDYNAAQGDEEYHETARFVAESVTLQLNGIESVPVTASVRRIYTNVNNAVLVYDFLKGKWCGHDEATGLTVADFRKLKVGGEEKLFFISADGFVNYAEALFDDEVAYEALGSNLHGTGVYDAFGYQITTGLIPGRRYVYESGAYESYSTNGSQTFTGGVGAGSFVAESGTLTSYGTTGQLIGFKLRLVDWTLEYAAVQDELVTRAYRAGSLHNKRFPWMRLAVSTFNPSYTLEALTDGVNEEFTLVEDETKNNTLYLRPANTPAWDETNANDDHGNKYREDYHVELSDDISNGADIVAGLTYYVDSADCNADAYIIYNTVSYGRGTTFVGVAGVTTWSTSSGTPRVYPPGSYILPGVNGIVMDLHQTRMETYRVGKRGREIQFRLSNAQGRCKLLSLEVEAFAVDRRELKSRI